MKAHTDFVWRVLLVSALLVLTGCGRPVPGIGTLDADVHTGQVTALITPGQTQVTRIEAEFGIRPTFANAVAVFWTSNNIQSLSSDSTTIVPLPQRNPFVAKFMIGRDFPLFDGQVVDVQFKVFYKRPDSDNELAFWSSRQSFAAGGHVLPTTNLCVFRYRRSTGNLDTAPNMPEEQVTTHHFEVPGPPGPSSAPVSGSSTFVIGGPLQGQVRDFFDDCSREHPCFGSNARVFSNPGRNQVNVILKQAFGQQLEHLGPGDTVVASGDISSISCNLVANPEDVIRALCRAIPNDPACASQPH